MTYTIGWHRICSKTEKRILYGKIANITDQLTYNYHGKNKYKRWTVYIVNKYYTQAIWNKWKNGVKNTYKSLGEKGICIKIFIQK